MPGLWDAYFDVIVLSLLIVPLWAWPILGFVCFGLATAFGFMLGRAHS
jgi:hypothetical protein